MAATFTTLLPVLLAFASSQRAPCYQCELFKEKHPEAKPYEEIRSHCTYPCRCPAPPVCPDGVHLIADGCGCCQICARQQGDMCDGTHLCDQERGLVCEYPSEMATTGLCRVIRGASCHVGGGRSYADGESFTLDCRTQCTCQNGTYGCVSLCSQEDIRPSARCLNPRLVQVPGKCCREWMCDPSSDQTATGGGCRRFVTDWSPCSITCGTGTSIRVSNDNAACVKRNESRICQLRPCQPEHHVRHQRRRSHGCRATVKTRTPQHFVFDNCTSLELFRPKFCGSCGRSAECCEPHLTTTLPSVPFECKGPRGHIYFRSHALMSILKCVCANHGCPERDSSRDGHRHHRL